MNIAIFNQLRKFEPYMATAVKANCMRGMTHMEVNEMIDLASQIGIKYKYNGCPKCLFDFVKQVGTAYFEQKNKLETNRKKKNENK